MINTNYLTTITHWHPILTILTIAEWAGFRVLEMRLLDVPEKTSIQLVTTG